MDSMRTLKEAGAIIYSQGEPASTVLYIEGGAVRLSVVSPAGREAVVAVLEPGQFLGEACLRGQPTRLTTATTMMPTTLVEFERLEMSRRIHEEPVFADRFMAHLLKRNIRTEEDLLDQLFNRSEKRLARTLLLLARARHDATSPSVIPRVSQELLAEMVGTTRPRVNYFMNRFRRLGFVDYNARGGLRIHESLLTVVRRD